MRCLFARHPHRLTAAGYGMLDTGDEIQLRLSEFALSFILVCCVTVAAVAAAAAAAASRASRDAVGDWIRSHSSIIPSADVQNRHRTNRNRTRNGSS